MERRVLLAVFLCFIVLYAYQAIFVKTPPRPRPAPQTEAKGEQAPAPGAAAAPGAQSVTPAAPAGEAARATEQPSTPAPAAVVGDSRERTITVDTQVVRAVFSNRGGVLLSWRLKNYRDDAKQPLELVATLLAATTPRPFALKTDEDPAVGTRLNSALFRASEERANIDATKTPVKLRFAYQDASGLRAEKTFAIDPNSYTIRFEASVSSADRVFNPAVIWGPALGDEAVKAEASRYTQQSEGIFFQDGAIHRMSASQIASSSAAHDGNIRFGGVDDLYFVSAAVANGRMRVEYETLKVPVPGKADQVKDLVSYAVKAPRAAPGLHLFAGPKDFDVLRATDPEMVRVINFGMFAFLAVPLLRALKSINAYVGNYGWAIIILTILINAAMFPLRHKSMVSMKKMQKIQPMVKAIQDRYAKLKATDPGKQKMNVEVMNLYRQHGVNPASGCLPMVLTMPVLFAFYSMLSQAIEVRGAPFAFWLQDLSRHDPYYVLPILMGITMLWQQKMTPSSADPAQQKMMMFMPIMFTAFFLWAPSGLALYFLLSNLLAIGQQYVTNNMTSSAPAPARNAKPGA